MEKVQSQEEEFDSDDQDDMLCFQEQKRLKVMQEHGILIANQAEIENQKFNQFLKQEAADFEEIKGQSKKQKPHEEINLQEISAKKLRAHDAARYFEKIKLAYLRKVQKSINFKELYQSGIENCDERFVVFLSILPKEALVKISQLKHKSWTSIDVEDVLNLMNLIFESVTEEKLESRVGVSKCQLIFWMGEYLSVKIRKVEFFDLLEFVDQSFYNLNYEKNTKKQKKAKGVKVIDQIKNRIQRQIYQDSASNEVQYVDLNEFAYEKVKQNSNKTQQEIDNGAKAVKAKNKLAILVKKKFADETFQIFSHLSNRWITFESIPGHFEEIQLDWLKKNVLAGLPIVGFFSVERLKLKPQFNELRQIRKMDNLVIKDMTMHFCDVNKNVIARRKRVGLRPLMGKIFRLSNFKKPYSILESYEAFQFARSKQMDRQELIAQAPRTNIEMNLNDYFTTPSRVGKYLSLSLDAHPIEGLEFFEQKMYWKDDMVPLGSRMGWIDFNRMVKQGSEAIKKTENRNKKSIELFRYEQTQPFKLQIDSEGNFVLDPQHNSIYVPPFLQLPLGTCIVKQHVTFICNKHKFKFAKLVQGFNHANGRILPNEIGYIVYEQNRDEILKLHEERQVILRRHKEERKDEKVEKMWRDLFKYIKLVERLGY